MIGVILVDQWCTPSYAILSVAVMGGTPHCPSRGIVKTVVVNFLDYIRVLGDREIGV